jgi:hypothetical protein
VQEKSPRAASQFISENRNVHKAPKEIIKKAKRVFNGGRRRAKKRRRRET